jgi:hypothetical protein
LSGVYTVIQAVSDKVSTESTLTGVHSAADSIDGKITACNTGAIAGAVTVSGTATTTPAGKLSEVCTTETVVVKGTSGVVYGLLVSGIGVTAGDKIEIYNSADGSGTALLTVVADAANGTWAFYPCVGITFGTAIYYKATISGGTCTTTVVYE